MNKSNLAQEQQNYQAEIVQFPKQERQAMSENKFDKGYVMSSRLYRYEVRPFLSDAAKNVYAELEDRINGFKDKVTDHVSYSQLQGGKLHGSKKMGASTVSKGLKELLELGVISIVSENSRKGNEYQINEVSLVDHFNNKSTTPKSGVLPKQECKHSQNKSASTPELGDTIELLNRINYRKEEEEEHTNFQVQNRTLNFIEYHTQDRIPTSFKNLCQKYSVEQDFVAQAKVSFPNHSEQQIQKVLSDLAQWSLSVSNFMPQKWMSIWLDFMKREPTAKEQQAVKAKKANTYQPVSTKNSKTMQAHDEFFAQYGIGSNVQDSDFIDGYASEIKTIEDEC